MTDSSHLMTDDWILTSTTSARPSDTWHISLQQTVQFSLITILALALLTSSPLEIPSIARVIHA